MTRPDARSMGRVLRRLASCYEIDRFVTNNGESPFRVLIGCLLSLRTKDEVSYPATDRLFQRASDPGTMLALKEATIARLIYPVCFYRVKAKSIRKICRILLDRHGGHVPDTIEQLLELPGVGRKTANLTVSLGHGKPGLCVDTHVHRISNRLGWVATKTPDDTEMALRAALPRRYWVPVNETLVRHGQRVCKPISPVCSMCPVADDCGRVGVTRSR